MAAEYQEPDWRVADYELFCLDEGIIDPSRHRPLRIRGPRPARLAPGDYFACLGAAQAFGRFCARPFPTLLSERLDLTVLNISHGGAGPSFFCINNARLLHHLNRARFVVVQVMSCRSESSSLFESQGVGHYRRRSDGALLGCDQAFAELLRSRPRREVARIVAETRASWCASYRALLAAIHVPKILFWFSTRSPDYDQRWDSVIALFGAYPQLVDGEMLTQVRGLADHAVSCVSRRGLPQPLTDRFTGAPITVADEWTAEPWRENWYYPSPGMHEDAAAALAPSCRVFAGLGEASEASAGPDKAPGEGAGPGEVAGGGPAEAAPCAISS
jgi:hypothetical protein